MKKLIRIDNIIKTHQALANALIVIIENGKGHIEEIDALANVLSQNGLLDKRVFNSVRTLKPQKTKNNSVGSSDEPHPPHTDGCYIKNPSSHIILQCVTPDQKKGGEGLFWTLDNYLGFISSEHYKVLLETPVTYSRLREDGSTVDEYEGPILTETNNKVAIRWRYDQRLRPKLKTPICSDKQRLFEEAIAYTINYFQTEAPIRVPYKKGDIIIASNRYLVHGRTRILDQNRTMHRAWLQMAN